VLVAGWGRAASFLVDQARKTILYPARIPIIFGDIAARCWRRLIELIPERPATPNLDRWYAAISSRPAFQEQIAVVPLS
jgi:glutathione S-transferase